MELFENKKCKTIVTIKADGSVVVTEQQNTSSYNEKSAAAIVGKFWSCRKRG